MTWLAQNLDPVAFGIAGWLAIAVGLCALVALGTAIVWLVWWSISIRTKRRRL